MIPIGSAPRAACCTTTAHHWHGWCGLDGDPNRSNAAQPATAIVEVRAVPDPGGRGPRLGTALHRHLPVRGPRRREPSTSSTSARWSGSAPARSRSRAKRNGAWLDLSYRDLADRVQDLSLGLLELGIHPGDRVAILSENRPEWAIADYACLAARCTDVPIYPTLPAEAGGVQPVRLRRGRRVRLHPATAGEDARASASRMPALRHVIAFDEATAGSGRAEPGEVYRQGPSRAGPASRLEAGCARGADRTIWPR